MIKKGLACLLICLFLITLTGCWDQIDIEDLGFVTGVGVDLADVNKDGEAILEVTDQFVIPAALGGMLQGGGDSGGKAYANVTSKGQSLFVIRQKMAIKVTNNPSYKHLMVIVVSKEIAKRKKLLAKVMDVFLRNPSSRRNIKVVICDGKAKDILNTMPKSQKVPSIYLNQIMENEIQSLFNIKPVELGDIHPFLLNRESYVIPMVKKEKDRILYQTLAVIQGKKNRMVGTLSGKETEGLNFILGKKDAGAIQNKVDKQLVTYKVYGVNQKLAMDTSDIHHIQIYLNINLTVGIAEFFSGDQIQKKKEVEKMERTLEKYTSRSMKKVIHKAQDKLHADIFDIGRELERRHYDKWQQLKNNWDRGENYFSNCTFHIKVNAQLQTTGTTGKTRHK